MQFDQLKRREFLSLLGAATTWPLGVQAQQPSVPVIGYLGLTSASADASSLPERHQPGQSYAHAKVRVRLDSM